MTKTEQKYAVVMWFKHDETTDSWEGSLEEEKLVVFGDGNTGFSFHGYTIRQKPSDDGSFALGIKFRALPKDNNRPSGGTISDDVIIADQPVLYEMRFTNIESLETVHAVLGKALDGYKEQLKKDSSDEAKS